MRWAYAALVVAFACKGGSHPGPGPSPSPSPSPNPAPAPDPGSAAPTPPDPAAPPGDDADQEAVWELTADGEVNETTTLSWSGGFLVKGGIPATDRVDGSRTATYSITQRCRHVPSDDEQIALTDCDPPSVGGAASFTVDKETTITAPNGQLDEGSHDEFAGGAKAEGSRIEVVLQLANHQLEPGAQSVAARAQFSGPRTETHWATGEKQTTSTTDWSEGASTAGMKLDIVQIAEKQEYEATGQATTTWTDSDGATVVHQQSVHITMRKLSDPNEVAAIPKVIGGAHRGDAITFDASASTPKGKLREYRWEFAPDASCPSGITMPPATTAVVSFRSLCPLKATLTVRGGDPEKTAKRTVRVAVAPRPWRTTYVQHATGALVGEKLAGAGTCAECALGRNACTKDGTDKVTGHYIHHTDDRSWENDGFTVEQIHGGPFDGWWYVSKMTLAVDRTPLVHAELLAGPLVQANADFCKARKQKPCDFGELVAQVTTHERVHGALMQAQLRKQDPAPQLEPLEMDAKGTHDQLVAKADAIVRTAEDAIKDATTDAKVIARLKQMHPEWNRPARVLIHLSGDPTATTEWPIPDLVSLGEP